MEADTLYNTTDGNEMDADDVCQMDPDQYNSRAPDTSVYAQPDGVAMASDTAVSSTIKNPFPFLRLPAEIRNMVYQYSRIYRTSPIEPRSRGILFSNMQQPPITSVNRQIRSETLPIFYHIHDFMVDLACISENHDEAVENWNHICKMLFASIPDPPTLQDSNLRFLSYLDISIETGSVFYWGLAKVGFVMSSSPFVFESDGLDEEYGVVVTTDLNWDNAEDVRTAFLEGIESSMICQDATEIFMLDSLLCERADEAAIDMAYLMFLISMQCPQLTRNVVANVEASTSLEDELAEARQQLMESDHSK